MRIAALLAQLLLVVGLAVTVASPTFVHRREPGFSELFERFRTSDVTITYNEAPARRRIVATKSGDSYLRIDRSLPSCRYDVASHLLTCIGEHYELVILITPTSATYCSSGIRVPASTFPQCIAISPADQDYWQQEVTSLLVLPPALSIGPTSGNQQTLRWSKQDDRIVLGRRSSCFRTTTLRASTFTVCLSEHGELLYASVEDMFGLDAIEATRIDHSVDMSVFDDKKFLNED